MYLYSSWLKTPLHIRHKIAAEFGIIKKGSIHVVNDQIQSDGYLVADIESTLTTNVLQEYLGIKEEDSVKLWGMFVDAFENPTVEPTAEETPETPAKVEEKVEVVEEVKVTENAKAKKSK